LTPRIAPQIVEPFVDVKSNLVPQILDDPDNAKFDVTPPSVDNPYSIMKAKYGI